jgi:hypothetical protein
VGCLANAWGVWPRRGVSGQAWGVWPSVGCLAKAWGVWPRRGASGQGVGRLAKAWASGECVGIYRLAAACGVAHIIVEHAGHEEGAEATREAPVRLGHSTARGGVPWGVRVGSHGVKHLYDWDMEMKLASWNSSRL